MMVEPHGGMLPFAILGGLAWLAILAGVVLLIIWAVRSLPGSTLMRSGTPTTAETPLDILARRFASGEITAEEYERSRDLLRGEPTKP
jgi:putative membrane protein